VAISMATGSTGTDGQFGSGSAPRPDPVRTVIRRRNNRKRMWYGFAVAVNLVLLAMLALDACAEGASANNVVRDHRINEPNPLQVR